MPPEAELPLQILRDADDGAVLRLRRGESVQVVLGETPTTGFRWRVIQTPDCCAIAQDVFEAPDAGATPGAGGRRQWRLEATRSGSGTFEVRLAPIPGRGGQEAERRFRLELTVLAP